MKPSNSPKTYSSVSALIVTYSNDPRTTKNAARLAEVFKSYNYEVDQVNERDLGLKRRESFSKSSNKVESYFLDWLERKGAFCELEWEDCAVRGDGEEKLIIVCYIGHGGILDDYKLPHLWAGRDRNSSIAFDLTAIQQLARNTVQGDVLFIVESCMAGLDGMEHYPSEHFWDDMRCEILAATEVDSVFIEGGELDFTRRLASHLSTHKGPYSVEERLEAIKVPVQFESEDECWPSRGYHKCSWGEDKPSIVLQPVVRQRAI